MGEEYDMLGEKGERDMKEYRFYGWEGADVLPASEQWAGVGDPRRLYDMLLKLWCADTCAPRMRGDWSADNRTLGQCSVTAFLAQDIFGGKVYGIPLKDGGFHCYNAAGECVFDLTSEQFPGQELKYEGNPEQKREEHFRKDEKRVRYELLKAALKSRCTARQG